MARGRRTDRTSDEPTRPLNPAPRSDATKALAPPRTSPPRLVEFARLEVAGYLGRDAQVVKTPEREFVSLSVATTRAWRDNSQQLQERTLWIKVIVFGERAEALRDLKKGAPVYAAGPLTYDRWEDQAGPRHAPVVRVTDRDGDIQAAPMPGGQYARVTIAGQITREADVRPGPGDDSSRAVARFTVQARSYHAVVLQGVLVEHIQDRLKTGHGVRMEGRLELHRWQDGDRKPHERVTVVVGGPETQIRVDRNPAVLPALAPEPKPVPPPELPAPEVLRERGRGDRDISH